MWGFSVFILFSENISFPWRLSLGHFRLFLLPLEGQPSSWSAPSPLGLWLFKTAAPRLHPFQPLTVHCHVAKHSDLTLGLLLFSKFPESGERQLPLDLNLNVLSVSHCPYCTLFSSAPFLPDCMILHEPMRQFCYFQVFMDLPKHKRTIILSPVSQLYSRNKLWVF